MKIQIAIALALMPAAAALAETNAQIGASQAGQHGTTEVQSFQPTPFEQELFKNKNHITQTTGEGVYQALCQGCHMPDKKGAVGAGAYPALAGNENLLVGDYPVTVILNGQKGMPSFADILDDQQIVEVVNYLQKDLPTGDVSPATPEMVQAARQAMGPVPQ